MTIPVSFATDLDTSENLNQLSDNNLLIDQDLEEESIEFNGELDEGSPYEASSDSKSPSSGLESDNPIDLPDLNTDFSRIEINCSDEYTIFVNGSYTGEEEDGTQLKPFKSLSEGLNKLAGSYNKTNIFIAEGSYNISSRFNIYKSMNIIGENPQNTIIDGLNQSGIFYISGSNIALNIINLTLANGLNYQGGAIYVSKSSLNIINTVFYNNRVHDSSESDGGEGGAIYNNAGFIKIYNSTFLNNSIYGKYSKYGGAIYNNLGELSVFNSKFINNSLQGYWTSGGAIYNFNGFLTLFNSSILNTTLNPSYHSLGGAICIWNGRNSYVINSTISGNVINGKYGFGSAIANKGVLLEIINSTISDNYANLTSVENSTVYNMNGIYHCENSIFDSNAIETARSDLLLCLEDQLIISDLFNENSLGILPSSYDLRDEGWVTSVKNQSPGGDCWAFAIYAALESYLLKNENVSYDFSENHMKNLMYVNGEYGTDWTRGGNHIMAFAYLLRGSGPVDESLDPFDAGSTTSPENLDITKYVTGFKYIPLRLNYLDNDQIKYAILQYGALYTSIYSSMLRSNGTGYSNLSNINQHAVAIVGWDDDYSRFNFADTPPGDGAFIVKNSWGTSYGQEGYYYISYYDATFPGVTDQFAAIAISSVENLSEYKTIYQYDPLGNTYESLGYNSNTAWLANQFVAESNTLLKAFGLYTFGTSSFLVNITVNGVSRLVQTGDLIGAGYHTIKLDDFIHLFKGDLFRIEVKLTTPDSLFPIATESRRTDFSEKVTAQLNQSFISPDGIKWYDIAQDTVVSKFYKDLNRIKLEKTNVCLKAYTEYADDLSLEIKSNASLYFEGDLVEFNVTISNYGDHSHEINVSSVLDNGVEIVCFDTTKGSFDEYTRVWTIDYLENGESETLRLVLIFNERKQVVNTSFYVNSLANSFNENATGFSIVNYAGHTEFLKISKKTTKVKSGESVTITLMDAYRMPLSNKTILVSLLSSNNNYSMNPIYLNTKKGSAKFTLNLPYGNYKFRVSFNGEGPYDSSSTTFEVAVVKTGTQVIANNLTTNAVVTSVDGKVGKYLKMTLKDKDGKLLSGKKVLFICNNKTYSKTTDSRGVANFQVNFAAAKTYSFKISFAGDDKFSGSYKYVKVFVKKQSLKLYAYKKTYRLRNKKKYLTATLKNSKGKLMANKKITITVNCRKYTAKTNSKGVAKVKVSLSKRKTYKYTVKFAGDSSYNAVSKSANVVIR